MVDNDYYQVREAFSEIDEWTTEAGTHVEAGEAYWVKPTFIDRRLRATCRKVYWDPEGLPGSKFDHGDDQYDCTVTALFVFTPRDGAWSHMDGKRRKVEAYNLDFVVGSGPRVRRDRANCNTEPIGSVSDDYDPSDEPLPTPSSTDPSGGETVTTPEADDRATFDCPGCGERLNRIYPTSTSHPNEALAHKCTTRGCDYHGKVVVQASHGLCDHPTRYWSDGALNYVCTVCGDVAD